MSATENYTADAIEVLSGLEPVKKRPGMYTDTSRPNHLAMEVIDNSVDEAIGGFATHIDIQLHKDGALTVSDDGRGMPVDKHKKEKISGVEVIMTKLHAGGKFSNKNYTFSGGLHGVGVSVVNALSDKVEVSIKRDGAHYKIAFANGVKTQDLKKLGQVPKKQTGTSIYFKPNPKYFDSAHFSIEPLKYALRAKAVLCPGLTIDFFDEKSGEKLSWHYQDGLQSYLADSFLDEETLPENPFIGDFNAESECVSFACFWTPKMGPKLMKAMST